MLSGMQTGHRYCDIVLTLFSLAVNLTQGQLTSVNKILSPLHYFELVKNVNKLNRKQSNRNKLTYCIPLVWMPKCLSWHRKMTAIYLYIGLERGNSCQKWRYLRMKRTHKHTETELINFGNHRCLSHSEKSKCMWTNCKDDATSTWCHLYRVFRYIYSLLIEENTYVTLL